MTGTELVWLIVILIVVVFIDDVLWRSSKDEDRDQFGNLGGGLYLVIRRRWRKK